VEEFKTWRLTPLQKIHHKRKVIPMDEISENLVKIIKFYTKDYDPSRARDLSDMSDVTSESDGDSKESGISQGKIKRQKSNGSSISSSSGTNHSGGKIIKRRTKHKSVNRNKYTRKSR
jgi:hypothetical protein